MNKADNFGFRHKAGVIMPVSSLPCKYGIGSFGRDAYDFVDFLHATSQTVWQVLPLNPTSYGDSPYQSPSCAAGNPYFIDLDILAGQGLLTADELAPQLDASPRVDYGLLFAARYDILRLAHSRFVPDEDYALFVRENACWLEDHALFMALKTHYAHRPWPLWDISHRSHDSAVLCAAEFEPEMSFHRWCQYEFHRQWAELVRYAHSRGIVILGDIPIYVAHDSADVWAAPDQFLLDENFQPRLVAACPPDGFSPDGQLWGNPIYNWDLMERQGFSWWLDRFKSAFRLYDILRIDHFRGFAGYYCVDYGEATARNGRWCPAPGHALFAAVREKFPDARIIAEDLGFITPDVRRLLAETGFPGMKMLHFAFYDDNSENLPRMYESSNCVVYSASHDSDCSLSWLRALSGDALKRFDAECPRGENPNRVYGLIKMAYNSRSELAMVPMQDHLLLDNEHGRMNTPATAQGNWSWRMSPDYDTPELRSRISSLCAASGRSR